MAPKGKQQEKVSSKVKEDKTFGLKNKNKSVKVQREVQTIKRQDAEAGNPKLRKEAQDRKKALEDKKAAELVRREELNDLFNVVSVQQKVPFGVDPKTVLCSFFKVGKCDKGSKCKFSHDLNVDRRTEKRDIYTDMRTTDKEKEEDTMENWDEDKLRRVVLSKTGNPKTTTDIVCKHFLQAVEERKYGWFWVCPNAGDDCQYRHSLPPGFVLKSQEKKKKDTEEISLEAFLETERHKIAGTRTPVTLETFTKWKNERVKKKEAAEEEERKKKEEKRAAGKITGLSGRDLFTFDRTLLEEVDDDDQEDYLDISQFRRHSDDERSDRSDSDEDDIDDDEDDVRDRNHAERDSSQGAEGEKRGKVTSKESTLNGSPDGS